MKRTIYINEEAFKELTKPKKKKTSHLNPDKWYEDGADFSISSSEGDLGYAHVAGGDAGMVCEEVNDTDLHKYIESYLDFLERNNYKINPRPAIEFNNEQQDGMNIRTGYYDPDARKVVVFINGRHVKDILRSFAHEMVHHMQNLRDEHMDWGHGGDLVDDDRLRELEGEAYHVGNILFREWTEELKRTKTLNESKLLSLILENEGTNMKRARNFLKAKGYSEEQRQSVLNAIRNDIPNSRLQQCKFLLGVTRLYLDGELSDAQRIFQLNKALKYIASDAHVNEYDFNLNGEDVETLVNRFSGAAKDDLEKARNASNERQLVGNENYTIVPIDSAEEASKYGNYTSWCVTHDGNMYNSYTTGGFGRFYFCLRKGFENEPKVKGEGCPLDSYGLSMIAVSVTEEGEVNTITCRWNHDNGGNDNIMSVEQLENVIGRNFYQTFLPYTREELREKGCISFGDLQGLIDDRLKNGEKLDDIVNDLFTVWVGEGNPDDDDEGYGEYDDSNYVFPESLDNGYYSVFYREKCNLITSEGKIVFDTWFDNITEYRRIFANGNSVCVCGVKLKDRWNVMDMYGNILWPEWRDDFSVLCPFDTRTYYKDGETFGYSFARVIKYGQKRGENLISVDGRLLSDEWYDDIFGPVSEGFYVVCVHDRGEDGRLLYGAGNCKINLLSVRSGGILSNQWFDRINNQSWFGRDDTIFNEEGFCVVTFGNRSNYMDMNGRILSETWFDEAEIFMHGQAIVRLGDKKNIIDTSGNILLKQWFDNVYIFTSSGFAPVRLNWKWNFVNKNSDFICDEWFYGLGGEYYWATGGYYYCSKVDVRTVNEYGEAVSRVLEYKDGRMYVKSEEKCDSLQEGTDGFADGRNKKTIFITEEQERQIRLLLENEGTNMKKARRYLENLGYPVEKRQRILDAIRTDIPNSRLQQCKFLLGVTRMYIKGELNGHKEIADLNKVLKYIASDAHVNEYDYNLNGENLDTLVDRFSSVASVDLQKSMDASNSRSLTVNTSYTIVPIDTPEDAYDYGDYTSWCVTQDEYMYNTYTHGGTGRFYFCLRDGFEDEPEVVGEGCPLDSYGLSMIAVSITQSGELNTVTCRWNHDNGGNDSIMTIEELENVLGRNFYKTFVPYTEEELIEKGVVTVGYAEKLLENGSTFDEIFEDYTDLGNGYSSVYVDVSNDDDVDCGEYVFNYNIINNKTKKFVFREWLSFADNGFDYGALVIQKGSKYNYLDKNIKLISSEWFQDASPFGLNGAPPGFGMVRMNNKYNFINANGEYLWNTWFDDISYIKTYNDYCLCGVVNDKSATYVLRDEQGNFIFNPNNPEASLATNVLRESIKTRKEPVNTEKSDGLNEATENDVDLSSFKIQDKLNPKIWVNGLMDSRVRLKLLDIAQDFVEFLDVNWVKPEDTIVVGSIANYNWSRYSDIDLHIVIDYGKVDDRKKFVENYFQSKKKEWNDTHDRISIFGFPVELYVQDKDADNASSAVYSIDKNKWLKKPTRNTFTKNGMDSVSVKKKASKIMTDIEDIENDDKDGNDEYGNRKLYDKSSSLIDDITNDRKKTLSATKDEMSTDNLVFKVLRRNGYLDKLFNLRDKAYDKMNSLD